MASKTYTPDQAFDVLLQHVAYLTGQVRHAVYGLLSTLPFEFKGDTPYEAAVMNVLRDPPPTAMNALGGTAEGAALISRGWPQSRPRGSVRAAAAHAEHFTDEQSKALSWLTLDSLRHWMTLELAKFVKRRGAFQKQGQAAYERLLGFHCLMGDLSPDEATKQVWELVHTVLDATMGAGTAAEPGPVPIPGTQGTATDHYHDVFHAYARRRMVTIDIINSLLDDAEYQQDFDNQIRTIALEAVASDAPDRWRTLWQALLGTAIEWYIHQDEPVPVRPIPQKPAELPIVRRATRVLAMVHELHKAGYQKIRILPHLSPSGGHWRCTVTFSDNIADDGFMILDESNDRYVARYSTGQDNKYFDWAGSENDSARELALRFLKEFPEIAERGQGRDWMYAGWLTDVLGRAEGGETQDLLYLIADWEIEDQELRKWQPPPPFRHPLG